MTAIITLSVYRSMNAAYRMFHAFHSSFVTIHINTYYICNSETADKPYSILQRDAKHAFKLSCLYFNLFLLRYNFIGNIYSLRFFILLSFADFTILERLGP
jgi:hypothetical protein